ncbi:MAG: type II secretion system protein [Phycisphaerae bacterium]
MATATCATWRSSVIASPDHHRNGTAAAFSLIELLVVMAMLAVLAGLLLPALQRARLQAKLVRVHADLYQIALGLEAYHDDYRSYPPARTFCAGGGMSVEDYNELPPELETTRCLVPRPKDLFNPPRRYKYIAPGYGYANNAPTILAIWVPEHFPYGDGDDVAYFNQKDSPVKFAIWSVGPAGPKSVFESDRLHIPVPERTWYRPCNGLRSDGVITLIRATNHYVQSP